MLDFILGLGLAAMLVRGWIRGFVRESLDLVGLVVGVWLAFRLSVPFGEFLSDSFSVAPEIGRIGGGIVLFVFVGVLLSVAAHYLSKLMHLPGLSMVNRAGGAAVATGWGVVIVLILVSLLSVFPMSDSWQASIDDSNVVNFIAGDDALPRKVFESVAGDNVMSAIATIRGLFGSARAVPVGAERLEFPPAPEDEIRQARDEAKAVLEKVNEHRVGVGLGALTQVAAVTELAESHGASSYTSGSLQRLQDCAFSLARADYKVVRCDNGVSLAGTAIGAYQGILETPEGKRMLENPDVDRAGLAVVDGPTGRLLVVIVAG